MSDRCYCGLLGQSVLQEDSVDFCGEPRYPVSDSLHFMLYLEINACLLFVDVR